MPRKIGVTQFLRHMAEFLQAAFHGETIDLTRHGKVVAHLTPYLPPVQTPPVRRAPKKRGR